MAEKTIEQLQDEISTLKETVSNLKLMNEGWQKQVDRQQSLSEGEAKRHQKEVQDLNSNICDLAEKSMQKDKEIIDLRKKFDEMTGKYQTEAHYADSLKAERDELLKRFQDEDDRHCGSLTIAYNGAFEDLVNTILSNGYEVRIIPDGNRLNITIFESEDK